MGNDRPFLGILFMVAFALVAPAMDAMAKATPAEIPVAQILAARFGIQSLILLPVAFFLGTWVWPVWRSVMLHLVRAGALLLATALFFAAVRQMPIALAISIFFVAPLMVTLASAIFLKEPVGPRRVFACLVGFAGAIIVVRPSFADLGWVALFPLGTAALFSTYLLLTRSMAQHVHPITLQAQTAIAAALLVIPVLVVMDGSSFVLFDPVWPTGIAIWTLTGVGVIATVSHLFLSFSLRYAPAAVVAPLQYLEILGATLIGYFVFGDFPDVLTWVGISLIVASGLFVLYRERLVQDKI